MESTRSMSPVAYLGLMTSFCVWCRQATPNSPVPMFFDVAWISRRYHRGSPPSNFVRMSRSREPVDTQVPRIPLDAVVTDVLVQRDIIFSVIGFTFTVVEILHNIGITRLTWSPVNPHRVEALRRTRLGEPSFGYRRCSGSFMCLRI